MSKIWTVILVATIVAVVFYGVGRLHEKQRVKKATTPTNGGDDIEPGENDPV